MFLTRCIARSSSDGCRDGDNKIKSGIDDSAGHLSYNMILIIPSLEMAGWDLPDIRRPVWWKW